VFACTRQEFIKIKNITSVPSMEFLQKFYSENSWRIDVSKDTGAINCYERLYYFWQAYKEKESFPLSLVGLFFGLLLIGKS